MARYELYKYKNGIYGHRYKGYFVVKTEKTFSVVGPDKTVLENGLKDYRDAEWAIDKLTASPETIGMLRDLYGKEIYILSKIFGELMEKDGSIGLTPNEREYYEWVKKVRARKAADRPY